MTMTHMLQVLQIWPYCCEPFASRPQATAHSGVHGPARAAQGKSDVHGRRTQHKTCQDSQPLPGVLQQDSCCMAVRLPHSHPRPASSLQGGRTSACRHGCRGSWRAGRLSRWGQPSHSDRLLPGCHSPQGIVATGSSATPVTAPASIAASRDELRRTAQGATALNTPPQNLHVQQDRRTEAQLALTRPQEGGAQLLAFILAGGWDVPKFSMYFASVGVRTCPACLAAKIHELCPRSAAHCALFPGACCSIRAVVSDVRPTNATRFWNVASPAWAHAGNWLPPSARSKAQLRTRCAAQGAGLAAEGRRRNAHYSASDIQPGAKPASTRCQRLAALVEPPAVVGRLRGKPGCCTTSDTLLNIFPCCRAFVLSLVRVHARHRLAPPPHLSSCPAAGPSGI